MDNTTKYIIIVALVLALTLGGVTVAEAIPVRNNNPGDLKWDGATQWLGAITTGLKAGDFLDFDTNEHGARAATITAYNYFLQDGITTLTDFGNRWAPPSDNEGNSGYGPALATQIGVDPDDDFDYTQTANMQALMKAIFTNEDVTNPEDYDTASIAQAVTDAIQEVGQT